MVNFEMVKAVGNIVGSIAGSATVATIVKSFVPVTATAVQKAEMLVGGVLIGGIVGGNCGKYAEELIDSVGKLVNLPKEESKEEN